jgi:hypothetical protein
LGARSAINEVEGPAGCHGTQPQILRRYTPQDDKSFSFYGLENAMCVQKHEGPPQVCGGPWLSLNAAG